MQPEKKEKKKKKKADDSALIIKEYPCKAQRSGKLYIQQNECIFLAKVLGLEKKVRTASCMPGGVCTVADALQVVLPYSDVASIEKGSGKVLKIKMNGKSKGAEVRCVLGL